MKRLLSAATLVLAAVATLGGCSTTSPDVVNPRDANRMSVVQDAVVLSTRPVVVEGSQSGIGGTAGAVTGAIAGGSVGGRREGMAVGVIGAVVGGVVGNTVERFGTREEALEILVQLKNGERRAIVQAKGKESLEPGDSVVLVTTGGRVRVTKAPVPTPTAPPATAPVSNPSPPSS